MALAAVLATGCATMRDTRTYHDERIISVSGGTECNADGETGYTATVSYDQRIAKSDFYLGIMAHGAVLSDTVLHNSLQLVGMDVALSYNLELGALYIQPKAVAGLGMVSHNTVMTTTPDMFGNFTRVERQQPFLAPEAGLRLDLGLNLGVVRVGVYTEKIWQFAAHNPTVVNNNLTVAREWLTNSPFSAGITIGIDLDNGISHQGGNDVTNVEALGCYGTQGIEAGGQLIFQRNTGMPWLVGAEKGLRGEYVMSSHYGIRFTETLGEPINKSTVQLGWGLFLHPAGPESIHTFRLMAWAGIGETEVTAETRVGDISSGRFGTVEATPKGNLELSYILRPFKDYRRFYFIATAGVSYQVIPGTKVSGATTLVAETTEKPFSFYGSLGIGFAL